LHSGVHHSLTRSLATGSGSQHAVIREFSDSSECRCSLAVLAHTYLLTGTKVQVLTLVNTATFSAIGCSKVLSSHSSSDSGDSICIFLLELREPGQSSRNSSSLRPHTLVASYLKARSLVNGAGTAATTKQRRKSLVISATL
jgi:hypothetical protein